GGGGSVGNMRDLAVLAMGASRLGSEHTIKTTLQQFARTVQGQLPGTEGAKWQEYIGGLGVTEGMSAQRAMVPIFEEMSKVANIGPVTGTKEQIAAQVQSISEGATQQGRDLNAWLAEHGVTQLENRRALIGMF